MTYCGCTEDGFCQRYGRYMGGRLREVCAGINIDLGTAAAFREQWKRESGLYDGAGSLHSESAPTPILLKTDQAPGDAVVMTAAVYSLHRAHPKKYVTAVESMWPEVFSCNPDVVPIGSIPRASPVQMHYPAIHRSNERGIHFMQGWCEFLGSVLGVEIPLLTNRPRLYFPSPAPPVGDYWVVCSGGKSDFTNKWWGHHNYQEVVQALSGRIKFVQVGRFEDNQSRLSGAEDIVGMTTLRNLFSVVRRARGVLCGVSLLMHVAAALEKPAVVIAGGREPVQWNSYPKQHYLHTVGALPCSTPQGEVGGACWRSRTIPLGDNAFLDRDTCEHPVNVARAGVAAGVLPKCMTMITPREVAELVLRCDESAPSVQTA